MQSVSRICPATADRTVHFRADIGRWAAAMFDGDTPGIHRPDFSCFDYQHARRPIYPLDRKAGRCEP